MNTYMSTSERENFNPEEFTAPDEHKEETTLDKTEKNINDSEELKKFSRRKFLKILGGVAASAIAPEILESQEEKKSRTPEIDKVKELYINSAKKRFENIKKINDREKKTSELKGLQRSMAINEVTIDDLDIETKKEKEVRSLRRMLTQFISSDSDRTRKPLMEIIKTKMSESELSWQDIALEKDSEDTIRLLPLKKQLDHTIWLSGAYKEKAFSTFQSQSFEDSNDIQKYLDYYYNYKMLDPFRVQQYPEKEKSEAMSKFQNNLQLSFSLGIRFKTYNIDPAKDKKLYEYLTELEQKTEKKIKKE